MSSLLRIVLVTIAVTLSAVIGVGLLWLIGAGSGAGLTLSYAAGLSMIFLPCTMPLVFVIVPLTMSEQPRKGLIMALLFGFGLTITLALYGIFMSQIGAYLGMDRATRIMFTIAGTAALMFGLSELHLFSMPIPGGGAVPQWVYRQKDYWKSFFLGFFLGNAGIGCPNPAFYVLLAYIATTGSMTTGATLGAVHGIGRATPLLLFAILGILGINSVTWIQGHAKNIRHWTAWGLVMIGAFILTYGLLGMNWWEESIFHASWNQFLLDRLPTLAEVPDHPIVMGIFQGTFAQGWLALFFFTAIPVLWYHLRYGIRTRTWTVILVIYAVLFTMHFTGTLEVEHGHGVRRDPQQTERIENDDHPPGTHQ